MFARRLIHIQVSPPLAWRVIRSHVTTSWNSRAKRVAEAACFQEFPAKWGEVSRGSADMSLFNVQKETMNKCWPKSDEVGG